MQGLPAGVARQEIWLKVTAYPWPQRTPAEAAEVVLQLEGPVSISNGQAHLDMTVKAGKVLDGPMRRSLAGRTVWNIPEGMSLDQLAEWLRRCIAKLLGNPVDTIGIKGRAQVVWELLPGYKPDDYTGVIEDHIIRVFGQDVRPTPLPAS